MDQTAAVGLDQCNAREGVETKPMQKERVSVREGVVDRGAGGGGILAQFSQGSS